MIETATQAPEFEKGRDVAYALWGKERADQLQKKIHGAHGRVFVVVHSTMARQQMPHIAAKIDDALMRGLDAHWPVIFFEEEDGGTAQGGAATKLKQHLQRMFPKLDPFIVETEWAHPVPSEKPPFGGTHKERWDKIRSLLTYVDAKHVRVGGIYLSINSAAEPLIDPREDVGCVNLAWKELSKSVGLEVLPAFGDGLVRGAPTTAREGGEQLREFLKSESEIRRGTVITEESRNARRSR